ncbi:hypothetical protein SeMB42_g01186 [Synchytrium endobioticum]|uniref:Centromere protein J C-terminal domain-containing protein n=1 Tax=Synchytrium endobioticum TaxID=286115 RepID=A0A507DPE7_9FUNG|nr:hypothetical protein SeLEV6574_g00747 [Synchytrium endobioticum]TPX52760.1 hypothetical protein SeMB42_g01186 [Synchytrium endobioticum]
MLAQGEQAPPMLIKNNGDPSESSCVISWEKPRHPSTNSHHVNNYATPHPKLIHQTSKSTAVASIHNYDLLDDEDDEIEARVFIPAKALHQRVWKEVVHQEATSLQDFLDLEAQISQEYTHTMLEDQGLMDVDPEQDFCEATGVDGNRDRNSILYSETDPESPQLSQRSLSEHDDDVAEPPVLAPEENGRDEKTSSLPSKLLFSLFPNLKPVLEEAKKAPVQSDAPHASPETPTERQSQAAEVVVNRNVKASTSKEQDSRYTEFMMKKLKQERDAFEQYKHQEMEKIQATRNQELKSIRREKAAWEQQRKVADLIPTKKERQEVEQLKKKIDDLTSIAKQRESRLQLTIDRLRRHVETLERRNSELQDELKVLEQERVAHVALQKDTAHPLVIKHSPSVDQASTNVGGLAGATSNIPIVKKSQRPPLDTITPPNNDTTSKSGCSNYLQSAPHPINNDPPAPDATLKALAGRLGITGPYKDTPVGDSKLERSFEAGATLVWYRNGTTKEVYADGNIVVRFVNGDYKRITANKDTVYWYAEPRTLHTSHPDGLQFFQTEPPNISFLTEMRNAFLPTERMPADILIGRSVAATESWSSIYRERALFWT